MIPRFPTLRRGFVRSTPRQHGTAVRRDGETMPVGSAFNFAEDKTGSRSGNPFSADSGGHFPPLRPQLCGAVAERGGHGRQRGRQQGGRGGPGGRREFPRRGRGSPRCERGSRPSHFCRAGQRFPLPGGGFPGPRRCGRTPRRRCSPPRPGGSGAFSLGMPLFYAKAPGRRAGRAIGDPCSHPPSAPLCGFQTSCPPKFTLTTHP